MTSTLLLIMKLNLQSNHVFFDADTSRKRYVVLMGSAGSGKSTDTAQHYIIRLLHDKGRNLLVMRKSEVTNRESTFSELVSAIYRIFGDDAYLYWKIIPSQPKIVCIPNGNEIIFRGMNDERQREKLKSITFPYGKLTDVWLEEATEFSKEDFEIIDDRLRGALPDDLFYQIRLTFNPVSQNHWIKKNFFDFPDNNVLTCHSTYLQNKFIDDAFKIRMERRKIIDPDGYKIYGLGQWGESGGLILQNWQACDVPSDYSFYDSLSIGQDFGFNHANAILLLALKDDDIYIISEIYQHNMDTSEIIATAEKFSLPKFIDMWCDSAEPDRIKMWKKAGFRARPVVKEKNYSLNYHAAQIDWLKQRNIFVNHSCINTINELSQWKWKKDPSSGKYLDEPVPFFDDAIAALRYGVEPWRKRKKWLY